ncbi:hypothetical protein [Anoxybacterium hadale]|uniref:hypothetical protein n=1 Tax=Anoxybacterium hadale TaxID=3408580 RepID=UPI003B0009AB
MLQYWQHPNDCSGYYGSCSGSFSSVYAGVVTTAAQIVNDQEAVQFVPPVVERSGVEFNGKDLLRIIVPGNYFCMGFVTPAADEAGPITISIGLNGPGFGLYGANNGPAAGQQVVCFGFTGFIPRGTTLGLYNASGKSIRLSRLPARIAVFRI